MKTSSWMPRPQGLTPRGHPTYTWTRCVPCSCTVSHPILMTCLCRRSTETRSTLTSRSYVRCACQTCTYTAVLSAGNIYKGGARAHTRMRIPCTKTTMSSLTWRPARYVASPSLHNDLALLSQRCSPHRSTSFQTAISSPTLHWTTSAMSWTPSSRPSQ